MVSQANLEQTLIATLRQLPPEQQQAVLDVTEFLQQKLLTPSETAKPSLRALASLPLSQRHQLLEPFITETAEDFKTDSELTEFAVLDGEDWEFPDAES